ncbi:ferredoxin--NADP+ reductase [Marmoricola sp. OAE513]|uniref:FAD-dependent oxidoreductase n=1 Tax=Marmoricola sp. OAE513 TaxID=2817894 RepID=UPI001AE8509C
MTFVITQNCCSDAACVAACPVGCIHPSPDEPGFATAEMLYIDPDSCIDCGACKDVCPVNAVQPDNELKPHMTVFLDLNADYYRHHPATHTPAPVRPAVEAVAEVSATLRVAIVGAGPSGFYTAQELLRLVPGQVEISMFDRLPTPYGLVRGGVAPDHPHTKGVSEEFAWLLADPRVTAYFNVTVGEHLAHDELLEHHHAVVYTYGARAPRRLNIPGEDLPGSLSAAEFVDWYNGHPDGAGLTVDLKDVRRVIVVGNGNVALDVARILILDPTVLERTDIADHALETLRNGSVQEVVLLGRRGPEHAAFTTGELLALTALLDLDIVTEGDHLEPLDRASFAQRSKIDALRRAASRSSSNATRKLTFKFFSAPAAVLGDDRVRGVRLTSTDTGRSDTADLFDVENDLEADLLITAVGYRGQALPGLVFDEQTGTVPNERGRADTARTYTAGWIKRGPTGGLGANRTDAVETVSTLLEDLDQLLEHTPRTDLDLSVLVRDRQPDWVDLNGWRRIDHHETTTGRTQNRPRAKVIEATTAIAVASRHTQS